jgi:hypothetical protein
MSTGPMDSVVEHLRRAVLLPEGAGLRDAELLGCFVERHDEAALAALVNRHGPMVSGGGQGGRTGAAPEQAPGKVWHNLEGRPANKT